MKKIILVLTLACLALFLFSCSTPDSCQHADDNLDGICDKCEHEMKENQGGGAHTHALIHVDAVADVFCPLGHLSGFTILARSTGNRGAAAQAADLFHGSLRK